MNRTTSLSQTITCLLFTTGYLVADPLPEQMTFVPDTNGFWLSEWPGVANRTYFHQWSINLVDWNYSIFMKFGTGPHESLISTNSDKLFVRLHSVDDQEITTLQQARDADFDRDGIPNYYEIETILTNPLDQNSAGGDQDLDGLPDGWEKFFFGSIGAQSGTENPDGDGLDNALEAILLTNPNANTEPLNSVEMTLFVPN